MEALTFVPGFDVFKDNSAGLRSGGKEAFYFGILEAIANPAHTDGSMRFRVTTLARLFTNSGKSELG